MHRRRFLSHGYLCVILCVSGIASAGVEFTLPANQVSTEAKSVFLVGVFNDWNTTATPMSLTDDAWSVSVDLPDGRQEYKYVWRDAAGNVHWMNDPTNPFIKDNNERGANNFVEVRKGERVAITEGLETFEIEAPEANWVALAGDFNDWRLGQFNLVRDPDWPDVWFAHIPLRRPFSYKYVVEGNWRPEPPGKGQFLPDGYGRVKSFRPAEFVSDPDLVSLDVEVEPGRADLIDLASSFSLSGDYGRAVALARRVADVNRAEIGSTAPLVLEALDLQATIHKRWGRFEDAAGCWAEIAGSGVDGPETLRALRELMSYHTYVTRDRMTARRLGEQALQSLEPGPRLVEVLARVAAADLQSGEYDATIEILDDWLAFLPPPDGRDNDYACQLTELLLIKGFAHYHKREWDKARESLERVLQWHPWPDSQNCLKARSFLKAMEERRRELSAQSN